MATSQIMTNPPNTFSIEYAVSKFVRIVEQTRSANTSKSYAKGLKLFCQVIEQNGVSTKKTPADQITEDFMPWFLDELKGYAPATEQLYSASITRFYNFLMAENIASINLPRLREIIKMRTRRNGQRLPQFPRSDIETIIDFMQNIGFSSDESEHLRELRDRAFIIVLADTGLRVHEACNLRRGDIDWDEGRAIIIGKGNKQAVIRFSARSIDAIKDYIKYRSTLDGKTGKPMGSLPVFARHDKGAGKKIKPITPTTGRNIVDEWSRDALGDEAKGRITPHSFRHYFVTTVLRASGNLKLAQELARHANISVTQRYAHLSNDELDKGYSDIFNHTKNKHDLGGD